VASDQTVTDLARYASPLRYPGGKAKLAPFVKEVFECNNLTDGHYAEPYAGGAGLALTLLFDDFVRHIHINDVDRAVHAFWWAVLNEPNSLCQLVADTPITPDSWERQRRVLADRATADPLSLGFATFFLNRTSRSGIIASGGMIGGKRQKGRWGIDARYNVRSLIARIQRIASFRARISLTNLDALDFLAALAPLLPDRSLTYLDPPYYVKGQRRLYANYYSPADHDLIAGALDSYPHCWLTSYDYAPEILALYSHHRCHVYSLQYTASTRRHGAEAIFFSDDLQIPPARRLRAALPAPRAT